MIRSKVWERLHGLMEECIKECGKMVCSMDKVNIKGKIKFGNKGSGKVEKESDDMLNFHYLNITVKCIKRIIMSKALYFG